MAALLIELDTLAVVEVDTLIVSNDSLNTVLDTIIQPMLYIKREGDVFKVVNYGECVVALPDGPFLADRVLWDNVKAVEPSPGGGGAQFSVTEYKTPGTYTYEVPAGAIAIRVVCIGGGGGGGSGRLGATGTNRTGGSGAWSGGVVDGYFLEHDLDSAEYTIRVGAGGIGGSAVSTDDTNGNAGSDGEASSFSDFFQAPGGPGGTGGVSGLTAQPPSVTFSNALADVINYASISMPNGAGGGRTSSSTTLQNGYPSALATGFISASISHNPSAPAGGGGGSGTFNGNKYLASTVVPSSLFMMFQGVS
jgi:hypothetical protein